MKVKILTRVKKIISVSKIETSRAGMQLQWFRLD